MNKFDIVLINFPYSDLTKRKLRPALVLTDKKSSNCIVCQITTKLRNIDTYQVSLKQKDTKGNIKFDSNIYVDMIFTLHESLVVKIIGSISSEKIQKEVTEKVFLLFK